MPPDRGILGVFGTYFGTFGPLLALSFRVWMVSMSDTQEIAP